MTSHELNQVLTHQVSSLNNFLASLRECPASAQLPQPRIHGLDCADRSRSGPSLKKIDEFSEECQAPQSNALCHPSCSATEAPATETSHQYQHFIALTRSLEAEQPRSTTKNCYNPSSVRSIGRKRRDVSSPLNPHRVLQNASVNLTDLTAPSQRKRSLRSPATHVSASAPSRSSEKIVKNSFAARKFVPHPRVTQRGVVSTKATSGSSTTTGTGTTDPFFGFQPSVASSPPSRRTENFCILPAESSRPPSPHARTSHSFNPLGSGCAANERTDRASPYSSISTDAHKMATPTPKRCTSHRTVLAPVCNRLYDHAKQQRKRLAEQTAAAAQDAEAQRHDAKPVINEHSRTLALQRESKIAAAAVAERRAAGAASSAAQHNGTIKPRRSHSKRCINGGKCEASEDYPDPPYCTVTPVKTRPATSSGLPAWWSQTVHQLLR